MKKVEFLYPELCNIYAESYNIEYLSRCCEELEIINTRHGKVPAFARGDVDMIYLGCMTERKQEKVIELLRPYTERIKELIDKVFSEKNMEYAINLMTIHKAKGLESDRVIFLSPKLDMKKSPKMRQWQFEQEKNLQYVAITRARKELILCYDCEGVEEEGEEEQE